jgi:hypothetical protein
MEGADLGGQKENRERKKERKKEIAPVSSNGWRWRWCA